MADGFISEFDLDKNTFALRNQGFKSFEIFPGPGKN